MRAGSASRTGREVGQVGVRAAPAIEGRLGGMRRLGGMGRLGRMRGLRGMRGLGAAIFSKKRFLNFLSIEKNLLTCDHNI